MFWLWSNMTSFLTFTDPKQVAAFIWRTFAFWRFRSPGAIDATYYGALTFQSISLVACYHHCGLVSMGGSRTSSQETIFNFWFCTCNICKQGNNEKENECDFQRETFPDYKGSTLQLKWLDLGKKKKRSTYFCTLEDQAEIVHSPYMLLMPVQPLLNHFYIGM